ncbi:uncharacterized protein PRCAT00003207001 [Priceomyces carsonii]|uniref:uncharacterized protein n=1 Tax=Priceomyces carsonii TaxID=28549 RepID=UPI002ED9FA48|nr:unnamed protein product [Priceomyces carsonii]
MSATKYFLGTAAILGGVYFYDQNVQPIIPRKQQVQHDLDKLNKKQTNLSNKFTLKIDETKQKVQKQPPIKEQIKDTSVYQNLANNASDAKDKFNKNTTPDSEKNFLVRGVDKYIDTVNDIGGGKKHSNVQSLSNEAEAQKNSWFNWFQKEDDRFQKKLDNTKDDAANKKNEWFSWGSKKTDELKDKSNASADRAEEKKNEWFNWGSKKSDELQNRASDSYNSAKNEAQKQRSNLESSLESTKNQFTSSYNEGKQKAIESYENAKSRLDELSANFSKSQEPDKQEKLNRAKGDFNSSLSNLKAYGDDVVDEINSKVKSAFGSK